MKWPRRKPKAPKLKWVVAKDTRTATAEALQGKKGMDAFWHITKQPAIKAKMDLLLMAVELVKRHTSGTRAKTQKSLLEYVGFDAENLHKLITAIFGQFGEHADEKEEIEDLLATIKRPDKIIGEGIFQCTPETPYAAVEEKIQSLIGIQKQFQDFCRYPFTAKIAETMKEILSKEREEGRTLTDEEQIEIAKKHGIETAAKQHRCDEEAVEYWWKKTAAGQQGTWGNSDKGKAHARSITPGQSRTKKEPKRTKRKRPEIDAVALVSEYPEIAELDPFFEAIGDAFECDRRTYNYKFRALLKGDTQIQLMTTLDTLAPEPLVGTALLSMGQSGEIETGTIYKVIAQEFGLKKNSEIADKIYEIYEILNRIYPQLAIHLGMEEEPQAIGGRRAIPARLESDFEREGEFGIAEATANDQREAVQETLENPEKKLFKELVDFIALLEGEWVVYKEQARIVQRVTKIQSSEGERIQEIKIEGDRPITAAQNGFSLGDMIYFVENMIQVKENEFIGAAGNGPEELKAGLNRIRRKIADFKKEGERIAEKAVEWAAGRATAAPGSPTPPNSPMAAATPPTPPTPDTTEVIQESPEKKLFKKVVSFIKDLPGKGIVHEGKGRYIKSIRYANHRTFNMSGISEIIVPGNAYSDDYLIRTNIEGESIGFDEIIQFVLDIERIDQTLGRMDAGAEKAALQSRLEALKDEIRAYKGISSSESDKILIQPAKPSKRRIRKKPKQP